MGEKGAIDDDPGSPTTVQRKPDDCHVTVMLGQMSYENFMVDEPSRWSIQVAIDGTVHEGLFNLGPSGTRGDVYGWDWTKPKRCNTEVPLDFNINLQMHGSSLVMKKYDGAAAGMRTFHCPSESDHEKFEIEVGADDEVYCRFTFLFHVKLTCGS